MGTTPASMTPSMPDALYPVRLRTSDEAELLLHVPDGTTVIEAAAAEGLVLPSQCGQGTCGSCHANAHGAFRLGEYSPSALSGADAASGGVLLCRTYPMGAMDVQLSYPRSRIGDGRIGRREGVITKLEAVADRTVAFTVQLDEDPVAGAGAEFDPGQFMELAVPDDDRRRAYSMANTPNWDGTVEFLIALHEGGYFSGIITDLLQGRRPQGQRLVLLGPTGAFGLRESGIRPRWFVAGGTGLAPLLSMLRRMAEWAEPHPARLILGVNAPGELPDLAVLEEIDQGLSSFSYEPWVWRPDDNWKGQVGTGAHALAAALATHEGAAPDVYVSGPPKLVEAVQEVAASAGLAPEHVITERVLPT